MRREFSTISAFSMMMFFMAATVVCLQIAHTNPPWANWRLAPGVIWALEIAIFGTCVHLWRRRISFGPWVLAIGALVLVRIAITHASALGYPLIQAAASYEAGLREMSQALPRACAALFSLIVLSPLRAFLPATLLPARSRSRSAPGGATFAFPDMPTDGASDPALWFVRGEEKIPVWLDARHQSGVDGVVSAGAPVAQINGYLELTLREVLAQIPQEFIAKKAARYEGTEPVTLPLAVIVPQLREARIVVRLNELCDRLPHDVVNLPDLWAGPEEEVPLVLLPLEMVVPKLPEGVLELPPPSPPSWAKLAYTDKVVFARV
jgi:hypothetical protein